MDTEIEFGGWELEKRLQTNRRFGEKNIRPWIIEFANLRLGEKILDVGCGSGEQVIPFSIETKNSGEIIGVDLSKELLEIARKQADSQGCEIKLLQHDANLDLPFENNYFDLVTCCFTIYHINNKSNLINEFHRVSKSKGRIMITGPDPNNNAEMFNMFADIGIKISRMPRDFYKEEIGKLLNKFSKHEYHIFKNMIKFPSADEYISYIKITQLFLDNIPKNEQSTAIKKLKKIIEDNNQLELTKIVGAYLAWK